MQVLREDQLSAFVNRFYHFHDAVLTDLRLSFVGGISARLELQTMDTESNLEWSVVTVTFDGLELFRWREDKQDLRAHFFTLPAVAVWVRGLFVLAFEVDGNGDLYHDMESLLSEASLLLAGRTMCYDVERVKAGEKVSGTNRR